MTLVEDRAAASKANLNDDIGEETRLRLYRIQVEIRRFDSWPGRHALIEADWTIRSDAERALATCTSTASENVEAGYDALVQGHQRAIARIAADSGATVRALASSGVAACPSQPSR